MQEVKHIHKFFDGHYSINDYKVINISTHVRSYSTKNHDFLILNIQHSSFLLLCHIRYVTKMQYNKDVVTSINFVITLSKDREVGGMKYECAGMQNLKTRISRNLFLFLL